MKKQALFISLMLLVLAFTLFISINTFAISPIDALNSPKAVAMEVYPGFNEGPLIDTFALVTESNPLTVQFNVKPTHFGFWPRPSIITYYRAIIDFGDESPVEELVWRWLPADGMGFVGGYSYVQGKGHETYKNHVYSELKPYIVTIKFETSPYPTFSENTTRVIETYNETFDFTKNRYIVLRNQNYIQQRQREIVFGLNSDEIDLFKDVTNYSPVPDFLKNYQTILTYPTRPFKRPPYISKRIGANSLAYGVYNPGPGSPNVFGVAGFVDKKNSLGRGTGKSYIATVSGNDDLKTTVFIFEVQTNGDFERHPDNSESKGQIIERKFIPVTQFTLKNPKAYYSWNAYPSLIWDETGFYFSSMLPSITPVITPVTNISEDCAVTHYDFSGKFIECSIPKIYYKNLLPDRFPAYWGNAPLARNPKTGEFWAVYGFELYKYENEKWKYQFNVPQFEPYAQGFYQSRHAELKAGLTFSENNLFIVSSWLSQIAVYELDEFGKIKDPNYTLKLHDEKDIFHWLKVPLIVRNPSTVITYPDDGGGYIYNLDLAYGPFGHLWIEKRGLPELVYKDGSEIPYSSSFNPARTNFLIEISADIEDNELPVASFVAVPRVGVAPLVVDFDASLSSDLDGSIVEYSWDFGDGQERIVSSELVWNDYSSVGPFDVTLTVKDDKGGTNSITKQVVPIGRESILELETGNVTTQLPLGVRVTCTKNLQASLKVFKTDGSGALLEKVVDSSVECNSESFSSFGPLVDAGSYVVVAGLDVPKENCSRCEIKKFITISKSTNFNIPDNEPITVLPILLIVMLIFSLTGRNKNKKRVDGL